MGGMISAERMARVLEGEKELGKDSEATIKGWLDEVRRVAVLELGIARSREAFYEQVREIDAREAEQDALIGF